MTRDFVFLRPLGLRLRGAIELPATITVKELAELLAVSPADIIRELIKSGIFATINQLIDRESRIVAMSFCEPRS